jgi:hypothetical protein
MRLPLLRLSSREIVDLFTPNSMAIFIRFTGDYSRPHRIICTATRMIAEGNIPTPFSR